MITLRSLMIDSYYKFFFLIAEIRIKFNDSKGKFLA